MKLYIRKLKLFINAILLVGLTSYNTIGFTHTAGATLGASGDNASATILAAVSCFNDGNGEPSGLFSQVKDNSQPVSGLLVNIQLYKGSQATNITDSISGDADFSDGIELTGGAGTYQMILNKTAAGARDFEVIWHCLAADGTHTGTDIVLRQFE